MRLIPFKDIKIPENRQRREFKPEELEDLKGSIQDSQHGLLHAVVVREKGGVILLVAGERRLRAIEDVYALEGQFWYDGAIVPAGMVPCSSLGELSELEAYAAELEENIRRVDLTWQEKAEATTKLVNLRSLQATNRGEEAPKISEVALEAHPDLVPAAAQNAARTEITVARHLDDPEVRAAPSMKEALKIIKKKEDVKRNIELAAKVGETFSSKKHALLLGDSQKWAAGKAGGLFDIILTDPPYGMGANNFGDSGKGTEAAAHFYDDSFENWVKLLEWFAPESFRLAKPDAHLYAFCDIGNFGMFKDRMAEAGWKVFRTPLIWHNPSGFRTPWPFHGPQRKYECILYAVKGEKKVTVMRSDVLEYSKDTAVGHPAQKPVELLVDLLRRSAAPGDEVVDFFAGSGATIEAANELKLACTAIEQNQNAYGIALKRLQGLSSFDEGPF